MAIVCACLPTVRPLLAGISSLLTKTSSGMRQRYYSARGQYSRGTTESSGTAVSRSGDAIEILPLSHRECHCGAYNLNSTSMETFPSSSRHQECYCGASLKDPRTKTVKDPLVETVGLEEELESRRGQRAFLDDAS